MNEIITVNKTKINVVSENDTFMVSNKEVAAGFKVGLTSIQNMKNRNADELKEGTHFVYVSNSNKSKTTMWTRKGIITLGFKLKTTKETVKFRDWASDYIIKKESKPLIAMDDVIKSLQLTAQGLKHQDERLDTHNDRLIDLENNVRLTNQQEYELTQVHHKKVYELARLYGEDQNDKKLISKLHRQVWKLFKNHFMLPRFNELQANKFNDGIAFLNGVKLKDI